ncbi:MAG: 4'-phosphopantetheinyl transferase superfamily protein [Bacteroidia bacterium]|nr:4'-phosphopantetheinyl transferase superfamily protein [Bacteroidia bacterium]
MIQVFNIKKGLFYGVLNLNDFATCNNISGKRDLERKASMYLLEHLLHKPVNILYNPNGKPYLKDESVHISISHSYDKLAIIINENEKTGIDIERIRDKVKTIKTKFLSESELIDADDDSEKLMIYWAAKETLFKIHGVEGVEFIKHLFVKPFTKHNLGTLIGQINFSGIVEAYELNYQVFENYVLVYPLEKI